jgi:hypothetical protein
MQGPTMNQESRWIAKSKCPSSPITNYPERCFMLCPLDIMKAQSKSTYSRTYLGKCDKEQRDDRRSWNPRDIIMEDEATWRRLGCSSWRTISHRSDTQTLSSLILDEKSCSEPVLNETTTISCLSSWSWSGARYKHDVNINVQDDLGLCQSVPANPNLCVMLRININ